MTLRSSAIVAGFLSAATFLTSCGGAKEVATVVPVSVLSIIGSAPTERAAAGESTVRSVTVRNSSDVLTEDNLEVRVTVPLGASPHLEFAQKQPRGCSLEEGTVTCPLAALPAGSTADASFILSVPRSADCKSPLMFNTELCRRADPKFDCIANDKGIVVVACPSFSSSSSSVSSDTILPAGSKPTEEKAAAKAEQLP